MKYMIQNSQGIVVSELEVTPDPEKKILWAPNEQIKKLFNARNVPELSLAAEMIYTALEADGFEPGTYILAPVEYNDDHV